MRGSYKLILKKLEMTGIKRFRSKVVNFAKGLNIIRGPNESGKSTIVECLLKLLFSKPDSAAGLSLQSWTYSGQSKAVLTYTGSDAVEYKIEKEFEEKGSAALWKDGAVLTENESRIQKSIVSEIGINDERVFKNTLCMSQGDMIGIVDEGIKTKEKILGLISGSQVKVSVEQAVKVLEEEVKDITGRSRSPDISAQRGIMGCLDDEREMIEKKLGSLSEADEKKEMLADIIKKAEEKKGEVEKYNTLLQNNDKLTELNKAKQDKVKRKSDIHLNINEMIRMNDEMNEVERKLKSPLIKILPVFLPVAVVLFAAGAYLLYRQKAMEGAACLFASIGLLALFLSSPKRRLENRNKLLYEKRGILAKGGTFEDMGKEEQSIMQDIYNIEQEIKKYEGYEITPLKLVEYQDVLKKCEDEYEVVDSERKSYEADVRALESLVGRADSSELRDEVNWLDEEIKSYRRRLEACRVAIEVLREAGKESHSVLAPELEAETGSMLASITSSLYKEIRIDNKNFDIKVLSKEKGDFVLPDQLSLGALDQIFLSLRIALSRIITSKREVPLILDDPFAYFDDLRKKRALNLIRELSDKIQIVIMSCHELEVKPDKEIFL